MLEERETVRYLVGRLGRITTVTDAAGVRTMTYDADTLQLVSEAIAGMGGLINRTIARDYSAANDPVVRRRPIGLHVGTNEYVTTWGYDDTGKLSRVTGPGLPAYGAMYTYEPNSDLVAVTDFLSDESTTRGTATRTFEDHRDVVTEVAN